MVSATAARTSFAISHVCLVLFIFLPFCTSFQSFSHATQARCLPHRMSLQSENYLQQQRCAIREELMDFCDLKKDEKSILEIIQILAPLNSAISPVVYWKTRSDAAESTNPLHGLWKLRYTSDASDSSLVTGRRGPATVLHYFNASSGIFTNAVEFREWKGKVKGFRVINKCEIVGDGSTLKLQEKEIVVDRRSRIGLNSISIPFIKAPWQQSGAGSSLMEILYLDDEVLVHRSGKGLYVLSRLYDIWDPAIGWTTTSVV